MRAGRTAVHCTAHPRLAALSSPRLAARSRAPPLHAAPASCAPPRHAAAAFSALPRHAAPSSAPPPPAALSSAAPHHAAPSSAPPRPAAPSSAPPRPTAVSAAAGAACMSLSTSCGVRGTTLQPPAATARPARWCPPPHLWSQGQRGLRRLLPPVPPGSGPHRHQRW